jgi:hypothetical protein
MKIEMVPVKSRKEDSQGLQVSWQGGRFGAAVDIARGTPQKPLMTSLEHGLPM